MGYKRLKLITEKIEKKKAKERIRKLLPRCLATTGTHVCEREIGHGNGWKNDKHRSNGFSWTDAYAEQQIEKRTA